MVVRFAATSKYQLFAGYYIDTEISATILQKRGQRGVQPISGFQPPFHPVPSFSVNASLPPICFPFASVLSSLLPFFLPSFLPSFLLAFPFSSFLTVFPLSSFLCVSLFALPFFAPFFLDVFHPKPTRNVRGQKAKTHPWNPSSTKRRGQL